MAERWRYAGRKHPPYCTCADCNGDGSLPPHSQPSNQLRATLEKWRAKNFDPHFILDVPSSASQNLIVKAHRRRILAYHPDKHNNDPLANELTKHINSARDELLGKGRRGSRSQREQRRRQEEAQGQREQDAERLRQEEELERRKREAEELAREAARIREEDQRRGIDEAEQLIRQAARRHEKDQRQHEQEGKGRKGNEGAQRERADDTEKLTQNEDRQQRRESAARKAKRYVENRWRQREQQRQDDFDGTERINQQNLQGWQTGPTREQGEDERIRRDLAGKRQEAERLRRAQGHRQPTFRQSRQQSSPNRRSTRPQSAQRGREPSTSGYYANQAQRSSVSKRKSPLGWVAISIVLVLIIVAYLIATVTGPNTIDALMEEWARLFN